MCVMLVRKNFVLTKEQCDFLSSYNNESEIVRRALDVYIETHRMKASGSLSKKIKGGVQNG